VRNRRDEARMINERCDAIEAMLDGLKQQSQGYKYLQAEGQDMNAAGLQQRQKAKTSADVPILAQTDLMAWAEEVPSRTGPGPAR